MVQRIGICLFGLAFFGIGLMFFRLAQRENSRPLGYFSCLWLFLGARVVFNSFRRARRKPE